MVALLLCLAREVFRAFNHLPGWASGEASDVRMAWTQSYKGAASDEVGAGPDESVTAESPDNARLPDWSVRIAVSQNVSAGKPSTRRDVWRATISDSVEECDTTVCFLQIALSGANVRGPTTAR